MHKAVCTLRAGAMPSQPGRSSTGNGRSIPAMDDRQSDSFVCSTILPLPEPHKGPAWPSLIANCPQEWYTSERAGPMVQVTNSEHFEMKMPRKYGGCCLNASWRHMPRMLAVGWNRTRSKHEKSNSWLDIGPRGGKKYRKSLEVLEASTGIEPVYTDLQSAASPLRQLAFTSKIKYLLWCAWGFSSFPKGRPEDCAQFCRRD